MSEATQSLPAEDARERASFADWLAVIAGTLGGLMALMDVSIVNAALPIIQGEIGATPSEGTWVGTSYLVAEIMVIPLTAWLERLVGLRRLLLASATMFTLFSITCGSATNLEMMILGRIGQGLAGGILIPTALTIVAKRLPQSQHSVGLAIVATTALIGPVAGPVVGGWLTENFNWSLIFLINIPICACQIGLLLISLRDEPGDWSEFRDADWSGIAGMVLGLGGLTTLLEEGHREQWFESTLIWQLAVISGIGFCLIAWGQFRASRPVIRLSLLRNPSLASAVFLMAVLGALLFSALFITPQFLAAVAGYNAYQAGQIAFIAGFISIPAAFIYPVLVERVGVKLVVGIAMLSVALGAFAASDLTVQSTGRDLIVTQLFYGIGTTLSAIPLQQLVLAAVSVDDVAEANGLVTIARNFGGSLGLAAIASVQDQRIDFHHWQLNSSLSANDTGVQEAVAQATGMFGGGMAGLETAYRAVDGLVMGQALVMGFNDMFLLFALLSLFAMPFALLLRPLPSGSSAAPAMH